MRGNKKNMNLGAEPLSSGKAIISTLRKPFMGMTKSTWKRYMTLAENILFEKRVRSVLLDESTKVLEMVTDNMGPNHCTPQYVLQELIVCFIEKGMHRIAAHILKERLKLYERFQLAKQQIKILKLLAEVYCSQGTEETVKGKQLYEDVLNKELNTLGKYHMEVGITLQCLGMLFLHEESLVKAEQYLLRALVVFIKNVKKPIIKDNMNTTTCLLFALYEQCDSGIDSLYHNIVTECFEDEDLVSSFFYSLGFPVKLEEERTSDRYEMALKIFGGTDVVKVTHSFLMLATLCNKKKLYKEAEDLSHDILAKCKKERVHSVELQAIYFKYCVKLHSKKFDDANKCVDDLLKVSEECFNSTYLSKEEKTVVAEKLTRYGHLMLTRQRQFSAAEKVLDAALKQAEQNSHTVAICHILVDQTQVNYNLKKFHSIDKIREKIIYTMQDLDESGVHLIVEMIERLIRLYRTWNRYDVVQSLLKEWPPYFQKDGSIVCAKYHCYLAITACEEKRKYYDKGYEFCQKARSIIMKFIESSEWLQLDVEEVLWVCTTISWLLNKMKHVDEAIEMSMQALYVAKQGLSEFAPEVSRCAATIACYKLAQCADSNDVSEYVALAEKVLDHNFQPGKETDIRLYNYALADALKSLAAVYTRKRMLDKSEHALIKALSITREVFGDSHLRISRLLLDLGRVYLFCHKDTEALDVLNQAETIYRIFRKPDSYVFEEINRLKAKIAHRYSASPDVHGSDYLLDGEDF